jgi:hypothetical protein
MAVGKLVTFSILWPFFPLCDGQMQPLNGDFLVVFTWAIQSFNDTLHFLYYYKLIFKNKIIKNYVENRIRTNGIRYLKGVLYFRVVKWA